MSLSLSISVVLFQSNQDLLNACLNSVAQSAHSAFATGQVDSIVLYIVDNNAISQHEAVLINLQNCASISVEWIHGHGNIGYGRAHNLAIDACRSDYHLVLNPDVILADDALSIALHFLSQHPQAGLLAPAVSKPNGETEYLCKRYPSVADFLLRGFAPSGLKRLLKKRLAHYEMRDVIADRVVWDIPLISGCFMFMPTALFKHLDGFDANYFLYFEDYDLSIRSAALARNVFVPQVHIIHYGGHAARKGWRHVHLFVAAAVRFFHQYGWRFW